MDLAGQKIRQACDGEIGWVDNPFAGGYVELPEAQVESMRREAVGLGAFVSPEEFGISYRYRGIETDAGVEYHVLEQVFNGEDTTAIYVDVNTFLMHKVKTTTGELLQPVVSETYFADYAETDGVKEARRISSYSNNQETIRYVFDEVVYNVAVDDAVFKAAPKRFTRDELIADAKQLADIIEETHPDPYRCVGGKIAFHRRLHRVLEAIPDSGMTKEEFISMLRPFVAAVGDGHTEIYTAHNVDPDAPGGIPLKFDAVGHSLYVTGVPGKQYNDLLGGVLLEVEGVAFEELKERLRTLRPVDNEYHLMWYFCTSYLWYGPYLQELLPGWADTEHLRARFQLASGQTKEVTFDLPVNVSALSQAESKIKLPSPDESGFVYDFLTNDARTAYLRIDHMKHFRESFEARNSLGLDSMSQEELDRIPSAVEFFRSLVKEMKAAGTGSLIVDLRQNSGGDALMADYLMYFLYGKDAVLSTRWNNVSRLSKIYLESRTNVSLEQLNQGREVPLTEGDYDFGEDYSDSLLSGGSSLDESLKHSRTFYDEWQAGTFEGYCCPEKVVVLTRPWTYSAGFGIAVRLYRTGATLVGTPSGQAPNSGANATRWSLENTGTIGRVAQSYTFNFPEDSELARVLPVDCPVTYELLAGYDFDPNVEVLYALDILPGLSKAGD